MGDKIIELLFYMIPTLITGVVAYYFFDRSFKNEDKRRRYVLHTEAQKELLPTRLQAYERMTLFLERISPIKLLVRVAPNGSNKDAYEALLIQQIQNEFDHNLSQQIYMSAECWNVIKASKNATIQLIQRTNSLERVETADHLRETLLRNLLDKGTPSDTALSFMKKEIAQLWE